MRYQPSIILCFPDTAIPENAPRRSVSSNFEIERLPSLQGIQECLRRKWKNILLDDDDSTATLSKEVHMKIKPV